MDRNIGNELQINHTLYYLFSSCLLAPGHKIGTPEPLVRELKSEEAAALKKKYQGKKAGMYLGIVPDYYDTDKETEN